MEIKATQRYIRQAPRKVRLVANTVKELPLEQAIRQLAVMRRVATLPVLKTIRQAVANAQHNHGLSPANLRIKELIVNDGATLKRWRAVSRGRAHSIFKKTCHVMVTLETTELVGAPQSTGVVTKKNEVVSSATSSSDQKTAAIESSPSKKSATASKAKKATVTRKKSPTKKVA